jgi:hypothetical protein
MKQQLTLAGLAVLCVAAGPAVAQEKLKIGVIVTLSGRRRRSASRSATVLRSR